MNPVCYSMCKHDSVLLCVYMLSLYICVHDVTLYIIMLPYIYDCVCVTLYVHGRPVLLIYAYDSRVTKYVHNVHVIHYMYIMICVTVYVVMAIQCDLCYCVCCHGDPM